MRPFFAFFVLALALLLAPDVSYAHEVYLLGHDIIYSDTVDFSPNPLSAISGNEGLFLFWTFVALVVFSTVFAVSVFRRFEQFVHPLLRRLKRYAPLSARLTLGVSLISCAFYQALFGPELSFTDFVGPLAPVLTGTLYILGTLILFGYRTRVASVGVFIIFLFAVAHYGLYMLTYSNYLGEILILAILGGWSHGLHTRSHDTARHVFARLVRRLEPYGFLIARVGFGVAIMYAAWYAKFLHSNLAIDLINRYDLTRFFPFDPLFVVLGAFIIESLIGLFFILGIEVRWNSLFFLFWLALSLLFFGEAVWPHLVLIGLNVTMLLHGYDKYTLGWRLFKSGRFEPVL